MCTNGTVDLCWMIYSSPRNIRDWWFKNSYDVLVIRLDNIIQKVLFTLLGEKKLKENLN